MTRKDYDQGRTVWADKARRLGQDTPTKTTTQTNQGRTADRERKR